MSETARAQRAQEIIGREVRDADTGTYIGIVEDTKILCDGMTYPMVRHTRGDNSLRAYDFSEFRLIRQR